MSAQARRLGLLAGVTGLGWGLLAIGSPPQDSVAAPPPGAASKLRPRLVQRLHNEPGPAKAWVFFTDKGRHEPAALSAAIASVEQHYNARAVERRRLRGQSSRGGGPLFDERDLPLAPPYVAAVRDCGARVHVHSRWLNALSAYVTPEQAAQIASLPFVDRLEAVGRSPRREPDDPPPLGHRSTSAVPDAAELHYGLSAGQLQQINLPALHAAGYTGAGVILGVLDTGFQRSHDAFTDPNHPINVLAEYDFVDDDAVTSQQPGDPPGQHDHGTEILGCLGAYLPGVLVGGAYDAAFVLCKTEDKTAEYPAEEDNYVAGLEFAEAHGADVVTSSLGYIDWYSQGDLDGQTAVTTLAVNILTAHGVHHCNAAGNEGHDADPATSHLIAPADALQSIACGAVYANGTIADFSSDGPTVDGRVKPELLAQGAYTWTVDPFEDDAYVADFGTSLSTPLVAGAVACLVQAHPEWTVNEMRLRLFQTASEQITHGAPDPEFVRGYGILNAHAAAQDCNNNGVPDLVDITFGTSEDCAGDGVPDECEPDCNSNGVADSCDLLNETSHDCNANDVPDECDIASGASLDIDGNDVPDECDGDCNENDLPDTLDIAEGTSADCNANAVPDECELFIIVPLIVQSPSASGAAVAQDFADVQMDEYSTKSWDDFTTKDAVVLGPGEAYFTPPTWPGLGVIDFRVEIANAPGGTEVGATVTYATTGVGEYGTGRVTWDFDEALLPAGTWWISVQAEGGFQPYGQTFWRWANVDQPRGSEFYVHNPGGGFGLGTQPVRSSVWSDQAADLAFRQDIVVNADCDSNGVPDECQSHLAPELVSDLASLTGYRGEPLTLSVEAVGHEPLWYQWYKDGKAVSGARTATFALQPVKLEDAGAYEVEVWNTCGHVRSHTATLKVLYMRLPTRVADPFPPDGATGMPTDVELAWAPAQRAPVYRVLLRADDEDGFTYLGGTYISHWRVADPLVSGTTYAWQIQAWNEGGVTEGPVWTFKTAGTKPGADDAEQQSAADSPGSEEQDSPGADTGDGESNTPTTSGAGACPVVATAVLALTLVGAARRRRPA